MIVIVAYDISDDYKRDRAAKLLLSMGFQRIQRSLYAARGGREKARQVAAALKRIIDPVTDRVDIILVHDHTWETRIVIGEGANIPGAKPKPGVTLA
ncbi:CRISPR-associated protein Cas2 [Pyrolobus fumarii 1A]|uniref:CRISPR-associated endoribonuclease Cas2 n=1 Tax=Pyrolobus fumarii (strain DSM 11204 / 1A) TaxID=694429 RepID=G0EGJ6_PYRF1|nr:CRISPR-associated endonuclease Cas2 [Pyrolobus fumarii]AEM38370.1 CRISPR-associated protein Cas2 [Pyrolobus fumarii 1A]